MTKRYVVSAGALAVLFVSSCVGSVCGCPPVDTSALAYVRGTVVDDRAVAVPDVEVEPTGTVGFDCSFDDRSAGAREVAVTDSVGAFQQLVSVFNGAGTHCVEFVVRERSGLWTDTVSAIPIVFIHHSQPPDTTTIVLEITP